MYIRLFVLILLIFSLTIAPTTINAQLNSDVLPAIELRGFQPTQLVDCPTAGTLPRGSFITVMRAYPSGGILARTSIGLSNRLMVGVSYGAEGVLAEERPNWNPRIEFDVKLSVVDEGLVFPAASIGFCSQGYGSYITDLERYTFKSKGFYVVASKNYPIYDWQVGFHGGLNYSTEQEDDDDDLNFFIGLDTRLNQEVGLVVEYDFATNDNRDLTSEGKGRGYLNLSLQWLYADNLIMEFMLKNLNNNRKDTADIWRGLRVTYVEHF